jgi:diguanylate cyclase (GGDEF)-like protein
VTPVGGAGPSAPIDEPRVHRPASQSDREDALVSDVRAGAWPTPGVVRVAALAARLLQARDVVMTVRSRGLQRPVTVRIDAAGVSRLSEPAARESGSPTVPLLTSRGQTLGSLRIHGRRRGRIAPDELLMLRELGRIVADELQLEHELLRERSVNRARAEREIQAAQDVASVAVAVRTLSEREDPVHAMQAICEIALQLTGADAGVILDLADGEMRLVPASTAGRRWRIGDVDLTDTTAAPARAYRSGKALLLTGDGVTGAERNRGDRGADQCTLWQPFAAGGRTSVAVLALLWADGLTIEPIRLLAIAELLTTEATGVLERADLVAQLADLARTDELTGLPNRRAIDEELARELERARRERGPLCVALLDLDWFKRFNDTQGHPAGDALLAAAAGAWRESLRAGSDHLGRYGGEEFLAVVPASVDEARATVERLRSVTPQGQTISAGIAEWDGLESAQALVGRADVALYAAKARGRDRSEVAAPTTGQIGVLRATSPRPSGRDR